MEKNNLEKIRLCLKNKDYMIDIISIVVIICISLPYIINLDVPYLQTDEYGYWGSAAFFAGYDWSSTVSVNGYFSYGYGLILSVLFKITKNPIVRFKLALFINILCIIGLYFVLNKLCTLMFKESVNNIIRKCTCLSASLYCSVVTYMGISLPECLLTFLFAVNVWLMMLYIKEPSIKKELIVLLLSTYLYITHQRTIVIMFINIIILIIENIFSKQKNNKKLQKIIIICICSIILFIICEYVKNIVQNNVWITKNSVVSSTVEANNYSGVLIKLKYFFSREGIISFLFNFIGRIYNMVLGTLGLMALILYHMVKVMFDKEESVKIRFFSFYLLCILILSISISSLFMLGNSSSTYLFYGRYTDHLIPVFILILLDAVDENVHKPIFISSFLILCMVFVLHKKISDGGFNAWDNISISHVASSNFYYNNNYDIYLTGIFIVDVLMFYLLFSIIEWKYKYMALCLFVMIFQLKWGYNAIAQFYKPEVLEEISQIIDISMVLRDEEISNISLIVNVDPATGIAGKNDKYGKVIQFINEDTEINLITNEEILKEKGKFYICHRQTLDDLEEIEIMYANDKFVLLMY